MAINGFNDWDYYSDETWDDFGILNWDDISDVGLPLQRIAFVVFPIQELEFVFTEVGELKFSIEPQLEVLLRSDQ